MQRLIPGVTRSVARVVFGHSGCGGVVELPHSRHARRQLVLDARHRTCRIRTGRFDLKPLAGTVGSHDLTVATRLKDAGGCFSARRTAPQFGYYGGADSHLYGPTHNPWKHGHTAGGSSGEAAASVAAGLGPRPRARTVRARCASRRRCAAWPGSSRRWVASRTRFSTVGTHPHLPRADHPHGRRCGPDVLGDGRSLGQRPEQRPGRWHRLCLGHRG